MTTAVLEQETVTVPVEEVSARLMAAAPVKQTRSITVALAFLIGCVALMMTGFAVILPVFPQRLQALGLGSEMLALMIGDMSRRSIAVRLELAEDLPQITGDRVQLQQVLMNLMVNGIDAMKDSDGTRELAVKSQRAEKGQVLVSISDTGVGLPAGQADRIFNAFFTTKPNGTGMGLRISRSIIEAHGGRLWASDNSPRGACFHLTLPIRADSHE